MCTEFSWNEFQPTLLLAPLDFSWTFFFALYGPAYARSLLKADECSPQSLKGTLSLPAVQSSRGSTGTVVLAEKFAFRVFHDPDTASVAAKGRPLSSTTKKLTRFWDGW